jgi:hypothetical protein
VVHPKERRHHHQEHHRRCRLRLVPRLLVQVEHRECNKQWMLGPQSVCRLWWRVLRLLKWARLDLLECLLVRVELSQGFRLVLVEVVLDLWLVSLFLELLEVLLPVMELTWRAVCMVVDCLEFLSLGL